MVAGDSTLTCNADTGVSPGFWVGTYPICHQIQCTPPLIPDATISPASGPYYYPDSIVITCNAGYSITSGKLIRTEAGSYPTAGRKFCRQLNSSFSFDENWGEKLFEGHFLHQSNEL